MRRPSSGKDILLDAFCHHRTLNNDSSDCYECAMNCSASLGKMRSKF